MSTWKDDTREAEEERIIFAEKEREYELSKKTLWQKLKGLFNQTDDYDDGQGNKRDYIEDPETGELH